MLPTREDAATDEPSRRANKRSLETNSDYMDSEALLELCSSILDQEKAEDIVTVPLANKTSIADYMLIASGRSSRQVQALSEKLVEEIKAKAHFTPKTEGRETGDWVLVDAGDVIIHIFRPEVREFYQIEKMWLTESKA